jgi:hypothetical protein
VVRRRPFSLRAIAVCGLAALAVGCGGAREPVDWAEPQTLPLGGAETCGDPGERIRLDLGRLELGRDRWQVTAAFINDSDAPVRIFRPHTDAGTYFGLMVFRTASAEEIERRVREARIHIQLIADRFRPPLPRLVEPGQGWRGTFSGPGRLPRGRDVRVVLGRFSIKHRAPPVGFLCISERGTRIP